MKAAVLHEYNTPLVIEEVTFDGPGPGEVLVRMAAAGICHSDLHAMQGHIPRPLPLLPGHEGAGIVEAVGAGVTRVRPGDHVVLIWLPACGKCHYCRNGRPNLCDATQSAGPLRLADSGQEVHRNLDVGAFAEYALVREAGVVRVRDDAPPGPAALVGCAVMTGVGAVLNTAQVAPGSQVAVIGVGGVGINVVQGARLAGAETIIAVDLIEAKLEAARKFGATHTINPRDTDTVQAIRELTNGLGVDYAFEVIGRPETIRQAFYATRKGGTTVVVGLAGAERDVTLNAFHLMRTEKVLRGCFCGSADPQRYIPQLLDWYLDGRLQLDELISLRYRLEQINEAFEALQRGQVLRSIIEFE
jgi:S-(hydroxymethyl)glutathione dehydrogenase/alcohol dehydrogenase